MRGSPPGPLLLVSTLSALLGTALGWCLGGVAARGGPRAPAQIPLAAASSAPLAPTLASVEAAALEARGAQAEQARVAESTRTPDAQRAAAPAAALDPSLDRELRAFLRSGAIEELLARDPGQVMTWMAMKYLEVGRPLDALELLRRHPEENAWTYMRVGEECAKAGDRAAAAEAFLAALDRQPFESDAIRELCALDPAAALARFDAHAAEIGIEPRGVAAIDRARLLSALGRDDEALALVDAQLADGVLDLDVWRALAEMNPSAAESRLREARGADETGTLALELARLVFRDAERRAEAVGVLEELLDARPEHAEALGLLAELDPARLAARFDGGAEIEVEGPVWNAVAKELAARGRTADAAEAWVRALQSSADDEEAIASLLVHAPARLWSFFEQAATSPDDDELLGDAADFYWVQGRREEAIELWRRANRIDPTDDEWLDKLRDALSGVEPL